MDEILAIALTAGGFAGFWAFLMLFN